MAALCDGVPVVATTRFVRHSHAEHIATAMDYILKTAQITPADFSAAGISVGPGSFTGLRIGIGFIKGLFFETETPLLPISSLLCLAYSLHCTSGQIIAAMDGRQDKVFCGRFMKTADMVERVSQDCLMESSDFLCLCSEGGQTIVFDTVGNVKSCGLKMHEAGVSHSIVLLSSQLALQRGLSAALIAAATPRQNTAWCKPVDITPVYLQSSYAEKKLTHD